MLTRTRASFRERKNARKSCDWRIFLALASLLALFRIGDLHQRFLDPLRILQAHRQEVAVPAPLAGPLVEAAGGDLAADVVSLFEELRQVVARSPGHVPLDLGL